MTTSWLEAGLLVLAACGGGETIGHVAGPPLTIEPPALADSAYQKGGPLTVAFVDLTPVGTKVHVDGCNAIVVAVAKGHAKAMGKELTQGDAVVDRTVLPEELVVSGEGLAVVATITAKCAAGAFPPPSKVDASRASALTWANGTMHAHLDIETELAPEGYFGRLSGTGPIPEHVHDQSWEVLADVSGTGTLTLAGKPEHVAAREVVFIPPGTKHSWMPDAGQTLVALQIFTPPGPERRFVGLAAERAN